MAIPIELFRFRIVRNIQPQRAPDKVIDLSHLVSVAPSPQERKPRKDLGYQPIEPETLDHWLGDLATRLALRGDRCSPDDVRKLLPHGWKQRASSDKWSSLKRNLAGSLAAAFDDVTSQREPDGAETVEALSRLLRVHSLVERLSADEGKAEDARMLRSWRDVQAIATYAPVILPKGYFRPCAIRPRFVREPDWTDFFVVRDEWNRYEAGQIARVLNVLPGEVFDTRIYRRESTETTVSTTVDSRTAEQTQNSQTSSTSLSQTSTTDASLSIGVQGQVEVSGQYGPAHIQVSAGAQVQASLAHSETKALVTATETVQRSVKEVSKTIVTAQTRRTVSTDSTTERHKLSNTDTGVTVGMYRWLSEVHRVQVWRYPNRLVLEFQIPEPGAWLRWAMKNAPTSVFNQDPGEFRLAGAMHDLSPLDLNADTIAQLATQWKIQGLPTPPPSSMVLSVKLTADPSQNKDPAIASDNSLIVPDGYFATDFYGQVFSEVMSGLSTTEPVLITLTVGGSSNSQVSKASGAVLIGGALSGRVGPVNTGPVPVTVYSAGVVGFTCNVNVYCALMPETMRQWQQAAFDQIAQAYQNLRRAHQQEIDAGANRPGSLAGLVGPPELNRARALAELRRLVIEQMTSDRFDGLPAIQTAATKEPNVQIDEARRVAPIVQFFEQAFEWENLVYICYPYYWARRTEWPTNAIAATADPQFDRFLNAGSARVVVPARPGFEDLVNYFRYTGCIWPGKRPPAPNEPGYLSVAHEIQALQTAPADGTPVGSSWEVSLPTMLLWAGDDPTTLPVNPNPTIQAPAPTP